jgi:hypothetical protein
MVHYVGLLTTVHCDMRLNNKRIWEQRFGVMPNRRHFIQGGIAFISSTVGLYQSEDGRQSPSWFC